MSSLIPWYKRGATSTSNPFASLGTDYCPRCRSECEADMRAEHDVNTDTFAYKKTCCRCGKVICAGMYNQVAMLTGTPLPAAVFEWTFAPGQDRR